MINIPKMKVGIVAVSRDCFPESLSVNRRKALVEAYAKKYDAADIYECPVCIVESEIHMVQALEDIKKAPAAKGKHIYWMHTIPFWSDAVRQELCFSEKAQIVGCELAETCEPDFDPENPFEAMAERMVYHSLNGSALRRIEAGIRHAKQAGADGAVWFGHWGCKHTLGAAQLAKKKFEEAGLPLLILDGDGCDRSHGGEGQTSTRLGAFLEMLGGAENE